MYYSIPEEGDMSHALLDVVTVHQRVGNGTFVVTPLGCKNVCYLLATK